jgi:hypothetical protein
LGKKKAKSKKKASRKQRPLALEDLTKKQLAQLEAESAKWRKKFEPRKKAIRRSGQITAKLLQTKVGYRFTKKEKALLKKYLAQYEKQLEPLYRAIEESTRITAKDLATRITI